MGIGIVAAIDYSLSIGKYNSANSLYVAGNGSESSPSDALVLDFDGDLEISRHTYRKF